MVKVTYKNGCPWIDIDGKQIAPAAFRSFRPKPDNIALMARAGMKLYQLLISGSPCTNGAPYSLFGGVWKGDGVYDFEPFERQFAMFEHFAPKDAYFNVMLQLDMPEWWKKAHPESKCESYRHVAEAAYDTVWRDAASDYLRAFIEYAERTHGDRIFGYSFACGLANEWFDNTVYRDNFDRSEDLLTQAWRDQIGRPDAPVPTYASLESGDCSFRSNTSDDYAYLKLGCDAVSELICHFAKEAQAVLHHEKLVGVFFGYVILTQQAYQMTNGYERVRRCSDIDLLYSPADYRDSRHLDGVSSYQYAVDSLALHGKLYLHEDDHRTELAAFPLENGFVLNDCYRNFEEWREVFRRELANTMLKNAAFWWFDFFGGYYNAPEYEQELALELQVYERLNRGERHAEDEIAVFVDPMSFCCIKESGRMQCDLVRDNIRALHRCGAPFAYYDLSDLPKIDISKYKLFVFLNAYCVSEEIEVFLREKLADKTKLFFHGFGMIEDDRGIARTAELCNIALESMDIKEMKASYQGESFGFRAPVSPMLRAMEGEVLAQYADGTAAVVQKGKNIWSGVGALPWRLMRDIARRAGVHLYDENGGGLAVCSQFLCSYTTLQEEVLLHPKEDGSYHEVFSDRDYASQNGTLSYHAEKGTTMLFVKKEVWDTL